MGVVSIFVGDALDHLDLTVDPLLLIRSEGPSARARMPFR